MNLELGRRGDATFRAEREPDVAESLLQTQHLARIFEQQPTAEAQLHAVLRLKVMKDAIAGAQEKADDELAADLTAGLREGFPALGDATPVTIADLDAREELPDPAGRMRSAEEMMAASDIGTSGKARDYFMQRLGSVLNISQLAESVTLPPALEDSLRRESERLATMLVAFERAERDAGHADEVIAA